MNEETTILNVINHINSAFPLIYSSAYDEYLKANNITMSKFDYYYTPSAQSYYMNGHCVSYANILKNIFGNEAVLYNTEDHVFIKINNNFYDVTGKIQSQKTITQALETNDESQNIIDIMFGKPDPCEKIVEERLIELGKEKLFKITNNQKNNGPKR